MVVVFGLIEMRRRCTGTGIRHETIDQAADRGIRWHIHVNLATRPHRPLAVLPFKIWAMS
jgi:hypothetical protein